MRDGVNTDARGGGSRFDAREIAFIGLVSALVVLAKVVVHVPLRIPGHTGAYWVALLFVGRATVRKRGAGTMIGLVSGVLATMITPGRMGVLTGVKYLAPGIALDLLLPLLPEDPGPLGAALVGALANLAKLSAGLIAAWALGLPAGFLAVGLGFAALTHTVFGALGGWLGNEAMRRIRRLYLPSFEALSRREPT